MVATAYYKDFTDTFRVPELFRWDYFANGPERVLEIATAPEETLQTEWTEAPEITLNPWHVQAIRGGWTRNLRRCFLEIHDEIVHAFDDVLALQGNSRNPEYVRLNIDYVVNLFTRGQIIRLYPEFFKPYVFSSYPSRAHAEPMSPIFSNRKSSLQHMLNLIRPLLAERIEQEEKYGRDREDRPTLTAALYNLAHYPEHMVPMREEANNARRPRSVRLASASRACMKRRTQAGSTPMCPNENTTAAVNLRMFNPHMVSTAQHHIVFGHGHHVCPGRFFATTGIKTILAHVLINYNIRAEVEGERPKVLELGLMMKIPSATGKIWIRKRESATV
ncbi:cytochrome P450 [Mycena capillaripes]|nr:cytochrome P450 [Mycena capillaripes]